MKDDRLVFFDLETGGLDPMRHPIIQIALVAVDRASWRAVEAVEMKVAFDREAADSDALWVNGWDPEEWIREALSPAVAVAEASNFFGRHATMEKISKRGRPYSVARLAAHNAPFDCSFLVQWFKAANLFCPAACYEPLDTLSLARWASFVAPTKPRDHKLESLCEWLGIDVAAIVAARRRERVAAGEPDSPDLGLHDALVDVRATVEVARVLAERFGLGWKEVSRG